MSPDIPSVPATTDAEFRAAVESSPFWPLVMALADIAARVEQRVAEEHGQEAEDEAA